MKYVRIVGQKLKSWKWIMMMMNMCVNLVVVLGFVGKGEKYDKRRKKTNGYCRELYFGNKINVIKGGNDKCPHYKS